MYLIPLVTSQMWMNDVKYNQVLNQTLVPPGVNSQATLQYTKSFKLAAPEYFSHLCAGRHLWGLIHLMGFKYLSICVLIEPATMCAGFE